MELPPDTSMAARTSQLLAHLAPPAPSDAQLLAANATVQDQARQRVGVIMGAELLKFLHENHSGLLMHIDPVVVDFKGNLADPAQAETMRRALVYVRTEGTNAQVSERILDKAPNVLWFHSPSAGVDFLLSMFTLIRDFLYFAKTSLSREQNDRRPRPRAPHASDG